MKIGDSVRIYSNDVFVEGKVRCMIGDPCHHVQVNWGEGVISVHHPDELILEFHEGAWSWRPMHIDKISRLRV